MAISLAIKRNTIKQTKEKVWKC